MKTPSEIEKVGDNFSSEKLLKTRSKTWLAVQKIRDAIQVGMTEEEAVKVATQILKDMQNEKNWHRVYVRFGVNTTLGYGEPSLPNVRLQKNDLFFVDIGPVWDGIEGDAGDTFVVGHDAEMQRCAEDARRLFDIVKDKWQKEKISGAELYRFAETQAEKLGWHFVPDVNGHRIADFPHAAYHRGKISTLDFKPTPELWVLEVQIRHPEKPFGAFFEDVLLVDLSEDELDLEAFEKRRYEETVSFEEILSGVKSSK